MSETDRGSFDLFSHFIFPLFAQQVRQVEEGGRRSPIKQTVGRRLRAGQKKGISFGMLYGAWTPREKAQIAPKRAFRRRSEAVLAGGR